MPLTNYAKECLHKAKDLIDKDHARHYTIPEIAKQVAMSRSRLKDGFKKLFQMGLYKYFQQQRLEKAKNLVETTDINDKELADLLGYKYTNNFQAAFKKKFGKSPKEWKNAMENPAK